MNNDFKEKLKCEGHNQEVIENYLNQEYEKYNNIYNKKDVQDYFHNVIAAIMLSQHARYEDFTIEIPYRFKAPKSIKDKINDYVSSTPITYDIQTREPKIHIKNIYDIFAMKIIACNRPPTFYSSDPEIEKLVEEKKRNHKLLGEMQQFRSKLVKDEFANPKIYNYDCTKIEYFEKCKQLIEAIESLISPKATNLLNHYDELITDIDNCLGFLKAANDEDKLIDDDDINNKKMNFFKVLDDFTSRIHDKLDLAVLTKQFNSLFENNKVFEDLGISLSEQPEKEKRTKDGFVSNFIYVDTLLGPIECQIQSQHEYEEGNYGYAAHTKLKGKAIKPFTIPQQKDKENINNFVQYIKEIAPRSFLARIDSTEPNRVITQQFSDYQNYKNLLCQVTKGDPCEIYILNYFSKLYAVKDKFFKSQEKSMGFVDYDINKYLQSNSFKKLKRQAAKQEKNTCLEADERKLD